MTAGEKCEVYKKVWVDVAPHERTVWKCLDKPAKKAKKPKPAKAKKSKPAKPAKEKTKPVKPPKEKAKKSKPAKEKTKPVKPAKEKTKKSKPVKKAKGKAKGNATLTIRMPSWFKKKGAPVEVKSFPVKKGPIKYAEDYKLKEP